MAGVMFFIDLSISLATFFTSLAMAADGLWSTGYIFTVICGLASLNAMALSKEL